MAQSSSTWTFGTLFMIVGAALIVVAAQSSHVHRDEHSAHDYTSITGLSEAETPTVRTDIENVPTHDHSHHAHHDMSHDHAGMTPQSPETTTAQVPKDDHRDHDIHQPSTQDYLAHDHHSSHQPSDYDYHSAHQPSDHDHHGAHQPSDHDHHGAHQPSDHDHHGAHQPSTHDHHSMHKMEPDKEMEMMMDQAASMGNKLFGKDIKKTQEYVEMKHHSHDGHDGHDDHDGHMMKNDSGGHHGMMQMSFYVGVEATVLFEQWQIKNVAGMIGSVIGIILLATFYEGLKYFREFLFKQYVSSMQFSTVAVTGESGRVTQVHKVQKHRMLSFAHLIQTGLHVIQMVISYFLMLIFMTYNVWLCLAVLIGAGVGYFVFGWKKATVVDITEHCH